VKSALYYETHVTIDPVFDERREEAAKTAEAYGFRLAKLIMRKRTADAEQPSRDDTFMTGHGADWDDMTVRTIGLIKALQRRGFVIRRYKIEDTLIDSRTLDVLGLLPEAA
jgi:hypothetical protein